MPTYLRLRSFSAVSGTPGCDRGEPEVNVIQNLIDFLVDLFRDGDKREKFLEDPERYLDRHGFEDLGRDDILEVLPLVSEGVPELASAWCGSPVAARSFSRAAALKDDPGKAHHDRSAADEITHLLNVSHVVHEGDVDIDSKFDWNFDYDSTTDNRIDNSFTQEFKNDGDVKYKGDIDVDNKTTQASGDGAVAAGDDIEDSQLVTGDDNVVAGDDIDDSNVGDDNNIVNAHGNDGSLAVDGVAVQDNSTDDHSVDVDDSFNETDDHSVEIENEDSFNEIDDHSEDNDGSYNEIDDHSEDNDGSYNEVELEDNDVIDVDDVVDVGDVELLEVGDVEVDARDIDLELVDL